MSPRTDFLLAFALLMLVCALGFLYEESARAVSERDNAFRPCSHFTAVDCGEGK